jgi:hypothetical protein
LNTEADNRISGDVYLQSEITTVETNLADEITNRISGEAWLQSEIGTVETNLNTEADNRISGDVYLQSEIETLEDDLETEINNRTSDVSGLQFDIGIVDLKLDNEITNREDAISGAIYTASVDATTKANTAESNAKQYADDLSLATQKWLQAVETSSDLPANPGPGTYLCRVRTGSDYGVYQWIGAATTPSWTYFSDNLDFIDKIASPTANNIPIITSDGELIDGGESISGILNTISTGLATKENTILSGTTSQYYRGDKTWTEFPVFPATAMNSYKLSNTGAGALIDLGEKITLGQQVFIDAVYDETSGGNEVVHSQLSFSLYGNAASDARNGVNKHGFGSSLVNAYHTILDNGHDAIWIPKQVSTHFPSVVISSAYKNTNAYDVQPTGIPLNISVTTDAVPATTLTQIANKVDDYSSNYSTTETFTGKYWIDGKPIYRKVFTGTISASTTTYTTTTIATNTGIDKLVDSGGWWDGGNGNIHTLPFFVSENYGASVYVVKSSTQLNMGSISTARTNAPYQIWVEYTKV